MKHLFFAVVLLAVPAAAQDTPFDWKLQPEVGSKWQMKTFTRLRTTQHTPHLNAEEDEISSTSPRQNISTSAIQKMTMDYDILSQDAAGAFVVRLTYRDFSTYTDVKIDGMSYSKQVEGLVESTNERLRKVFIGTTLTLKIGPQGQTWNVLGMEQFQRRFSSETPFDAVMTANIRNQFLSSKNFKNMAGLSGQLPGSPLMVGQGYSYASPLQTMLPTGTSFYRTRTLTARDNGQANFNETGTFEIDNFQVPPTPTLPLKIAMQLRGSLNGNIIVDEANGLLTQSIAVMRYKGNIKMTLPNKRQISLPMWSHQESRTIIKPRP